MALGRLFSALPVRQGDAADQIEVYVFALDDVTHQALDTVVAQAVRGQHPNFSRKFAPTCAELGEAIFEEMARAKRQMELAEEKLRIEDNRVVAVRPKLIDERIAEAKAKMAAEGRRFLFECETHAGSNTRRRECPVGSIYVGILSAFYGPPGSIAEPDAIPVSDEEMQAILRADMFEPENVPVEHADVEF